MDGERITAACNAPDDDDAPLPPQTCEEIQDAKFRVLVREITVSRDLLREIVEEHHRLFHPLAVEDWRDCSLGICRKVRFFFSSL